MLQGVINLRGSEIAQVWRFIEHNKVLDFKAFQGGLEEQDINRNLSKSFKDP